MTKRGQITIFVIIGIIIVAGFSAFFIFKNNQNPSTGGSPEENPSNFLEICMNDKIYETLETLGEQGGYLEPKLIQRFRFEEEEEHVNISFLCYNQNNYMPCINQEPMLLEHIKTEIKTNIQNDIRTCFDDLIFSLEKEGFTIDSTYKGFDLTLHPRKVLIDVNAKIILSKTNETLKKENFTITMPTRFYELATTAQEIVSQEARFCNFQHLGFMLFYPDFSIDKFRTDDGILIYRILHRKTQEQFKFAIRGCIVPPAF